MSLTAHLIVLVGLFAAVLGAGRWLQRLEKRWAVAVAAVLTLYLVFVAAARQVPELALSPWTAWAVWGWTEHIVVGPCIAALGVVVWPHLPKRWEQLFVLAGAITMAGYFSVMPVVVRAMSISELQSLVTEIDQDGVCRQTTGYTCGPAAAVTLCRRLGVQADEGPLGLACGTNADSGTPPDLLVIGLREAYGDQGLIAEQRVNRTWDDLPREGSFVAAIEFGQDLGHWIAVLTVDDDGIEVADPLNGRKRMSREEFLRRQLHGIVVIRRPGHQPEEIPPGPPRRRPARPPPGP